MDKTNELPLEVIAFGIGVGVLSLLVIEGGLSAIEYIEKRYANTEPVRSVTQPQKTIANQISPGCR